MEALTLRHRGGNGSPFAEAADDGIKADLPQFEGVAECRDATAGSGGTRCTLLDLASSGRKFELAIYCRDGGEAGHARPAEPLIVFCHGFGASRNEYTWVARDLVPKGYVVAILSLLNSYRVSIDLKTWYDSIIEAADCGISLGDGRNGKASCRIDPNRVGVAGHSMGGAAVIAAASRDRRFRAVVSISPPYFGRIWGDEVIDAARKLEAPTQIIVGSEDRLTPPKAAEAIYRAIGAEKDLSIIEGASHLTFTDHGNGKRDLGAHKMAAWFDLWLKGGGSRRQSPLRSADENGIPAR